MNKGYVASFVVVLGLVGAGVDYDRTSRAAGLTLGQLSVQDYAQSIPARISAALEARDASRALAERQVIEPRVHLAQAPEGWTREEWGPDIEAWINGLTVEELEAWRREEARTKGPMGASKGPSATEINRLKKTAYIYRNGPQVVEVVAIWQRVPEAKRGLSANVMSMVSLTLSQQSESGFTYVQRVPFVEQTGSAWGFDDLKEAPFKRFAAGLGLQVEIRVRARATDSSVREIISGIDFAGLNAMLDAPLADVGPHMPELAVDGQVAMAELAIKMERERQAALKAEYEDMMKGGASSLFATGPKPRSQAIMDEEMRAELAKQSGQERALPDEAKAEEAAGQAIVTAQKDPNVTQRMMDFFKRPPAAAKDETRTNASSAQAASRTAMETAAPQEAESAKPAVSRLGSGSARLGGSENCTIVNGVKRCRIGN